jgi:hypothetical protein
MSDRINLGELMKNKTIAAAAVAACLLGTMPAYGAALPTISFTTALASPGGTGNIEVLLTNSSLSPIIVNSFSFEVTTANPDITFTAADFATVAAAYIFAGNSFDINNAFTLYTSLSPLVASDFADSGPGTTIASGAVVSLGRILFAVSANAAQGGFAVNLTPAGTTLSDPTGSPIPASLVDGEITIASAPEPATLGLLLGGVALIFARRRIRG